MRHYSVQMKSYGSKSKLNGERRTHSLLVDLILLFNHGVTVTRQPQMLRTKTESLPEEGSIERSTSKVIGEISTTSIEGCDLRLLVR